MVGGEAGVNIFTNELNSLTSFRQSYTYGQDGWLTIETYGRGENGASEPDSGGKFVVLPEGGTKLICEEPTDAVIIRSTEALPDTYRLEVTVTAIDVGGKNYDPDTFWGGPWSKVWNGTKYVDDGSRYISVLWANGNEVDASPEKELHRYLEYLMTGQKFYTFNPSDDSPRVNTVEMVDKYIPGNEYVFVIERTPEYYKMSVTGDFFYGGHKTYEHTKSHLPTAENGYTYTWHFNQSVEELQGNAPPSDTLYYKDTTLETWPEGAEYPDYFFTGMPHINYYEGSMSYSSIKLYYPQNVNN